MKNFRNQRGSITLFVLVFCLFFATSVVCVQVYMKSKQTAVDKEYKQIKSNYEIGLSDISNTYTKLNTIETITPGNFTWSASRASNVLKVEITKNSINIDPKEIKYGWGTAADNVGSVTSWTYIENSAINSTMVAVRNSTTSGGTYHLYLMINGKAIYKPITVS